MELRVKEIDERLCIVVRDNEGKDHEVSNVLTGVVVTNDSCGYWTVDISFSHVEKRAKGWGKAQ